MLLCAAHLAGVSRSLCAVGAGGADGADGSGGGGDGVVGDAGGAGGVVSAGGAVPSGTSAEEGFLPCLPFFGQPFFGNFYRMNK